MKKGVKEIFYKAPFNKSYEQIRGGSRNSGWGGGRGFFSKVWGLGAALRPPMGPTMGPPMDNALVGAQGAKPPEAPEF